MNTVPRLTRQTSAPKPGIVHLGPGAFFRAFNAIYTADAMAVDGGDWGIIAVSLRCPTARDQLGPQGGVFTAINMAPDGAQYRQIDSIVDVLVAPEKPGAVIDAMVAATTHIVSLTITEKGYCHAPSTGALQLDHPDIQHDLVNPSAPKSAPGFLVEALARRRAAGHAPFTVLSCDNLPDNGHLARKIVIALAKERDPELADWIAQNVPFPATMVDRITPATTDADISALAEAQGYQDPACVAHEPFRQWVIEDTFAGPRPAWQAAGAQFVGDVAAHEAMKLRCLNGTHSALAYLGYLGGHETISDTVADPDYARFVQHLWAEEILPAVVQPEGEDLAAYTAALLERYRNPSIRHRTWQIAMDGSQKLPQRLLGTISENLAAGRDCSGLMLVVAGWMRYVGGVDEVGAAIDVRDPLADRLRTASDSAPDAAGKVAALLAMRDVFDQELAETPSFQAGVSAAYTSLMDHGAKVCVAAIA
ncbi:mannitol dehydrogenase family protein [uncultured Pelagimonas sp.]|uniref:mannitol dehydrogenase family protein n=1 Tax=uncultured Pelagimonas sp. TaxID=1618102 RepID=UPI00260F06FB|nr:mannitol dehydrogenase family protein [uncultured Pelagimonas sp.]